VLFHRTKIPKELSTIESLFAYLTVKEGEKKFLLTSTRRSYHLTTIKKSKGGIRTLSIPNKRLKYLQRKLLKLFEVIYTTRNTVHGFAKARSNISNATAHVRRPYILNIDLSDFFGTITHKRIIGLFKGIGIDFDVAIALARLCTYANKLPQGAPTSPILSNMICLKMDQALLRFCKANNIKYTRYADDITFSSYTQPMALFEGGLPARSRVTEEELSKKLKQIFHDNGFQINHSKSWFMGRNSRKDVTGLVVNDFVNLRRTYIRNIRASLFKIEQNGLEKTQSDFVERYKKNILIKDQIRGRLEYVAQIRGRSNPIFTKLAKRYNLLFPDHTIPIEPAYDEIIAKAVWVIEFLYDCPETGEAKCGQGTAFFLKDVGLVTAHHVIKDIKDLAKVKIFLPEDSTNRWHLINEIKKCAHRDLSILDHNIPSEEFLEMTASNAYKKKDNVVALGYPDFTLGDGMNERPSNIVGVSTVSGVKKIEIGSLIVQGMSGGPLINTRNEVNGIIVKGGPSETRQFTVAVEELVKLKSE